MFLFVQFMFFFVQCMFLFVQCMFLFVPFMFLFVKINVLFVQFIFLLPQPSCACGVLTVRVKKSFRVGRGNQFPRASLYDFLTQTVRTPQAQLGWGNIIGCLCGSAVLHNNYIWLTVQTMCVPLFRVFQKLLKS